MRDGELSSFTNPRVALAHKLGGPKLHLLFLIFEPNAGSEFPALSQFD